MIMWEYKVPVILVILLDFVLATNAAYDYVKTDELKKQLQDGFSEKRSFHTPEGKQKVRDYIANYFQDCFPGELHQQNFTSDDPMPNSGVMAEGVNFIYVLKGSRWGTDADKPIVVGAHYDSQLDTPGVDDNGSGMVAMLEMARFVGQSTCDRVNTAIFVAFDFEEFGLDGSEYFVNEYLKKEVLDKYNILPSSFQGALILETILNYNNTEGSQNLPEGSEIAFPEAAQEVSNDGYRGNFLTLIHRQEDKMLADSLIEEWRSNTASQFKILPLSMSQSKPRPSDLSPEEQYLWANMYRSDHYVFWDYESAEGLKALFITDSGDFRGNMQECYHNMCDNMESVSEDDLNFLAKTTGVITEYVIKAISEKTDCYVNTDCGCSNGSDGETCGVGSFSPMGIVVTLGLALVAVWRIYSVIV